MRNPDNIRLCASSALRSVLEKASVGKVHSIFRRGFNLLIDGQLIFVHRGEAEALSGLGVFHVTRQPEDAFYESLRVGNLVKIDETGWTFYMRPRICKWANPEIVYCDLATPDLKALAYGLGRPTFVEKLRQALDLERTFQHSGFSKDPVMRRLFLDFWDGKCAEQCALEHMFGMGPGLTPSGDDFFLTYLLLANVFRRKNEEIERLLIRMMDQRNTTATSEAYYKLVLSGYFPNTLWRDLFVLWEKAVVEDDVEEMVCHFEKMRDYGHTSGNDALLALAYFIKN